MAKLAANRGKTWSFSAAKYGAQERTDAQWTPDSGNGNRLGGGQITGNDPLDASMPADAAFQKPWIEAVVAKHGGASSTGLRYYVLDNEPGI